jgi:membrane-bound lytic murein transglycosylase C
MKFLILLSLFSNLVHADDMNTYNATEEYDRYEHLQKREFNKIEKEINKKWKELTTSSEKIYVNYYNQNNTRLLIDYENGVVKIESMSNSKSEIREILTGIIDEKGKFNSILSTDELTVDKISKADLINGLMEKVNSDESDLKEIKTQLSFNMLSDQLKIRAKKYLGIVKKWSKKNNLEPELVMSIIRHESAFNPRAESSIPAYGLMQIVPKYAGRDVMITIGGVDYTPTKSELFHPETNVSFGTSYIYLLKNKFSYFTQNSADLQSLVIAGYNWGPQRILNAIKDKRINFKNPNVYGQVMKIAPVETRNYLRAVTETRKDFQQKG